MDHEIEFPIKVSDLTDQTHIGISIYDMKKTLNDGLLVCTSIDIFDEK